MINMKEQDLLNQVMEWLTANGVVCWRNNSGAVFDPTKRTFRKPTKWTRSGVSDIIGLVPGTQGKILCIELKKPPEGKRGEAALWNMLSESQKSFIDDVNINGGLAFVADSLETVRHHLLPFLH